MNIPEFFGLDIGNHAIKVAQVRRHNDGAQLLHIDAIDIDFNLLSSPGEDGLQQLAEKIKTVCSSAGIRTTNCVAGISEAPVFSRLITLPRLPEEQLEEAVHWELKPLIPVPVAEVDIAFLEIGERDTNGQKMVDIFVVAAPKTLTEQYKRLADLAGLNLLALETEALANTRLILELVALILC
jgi:type IV pilus assembly protein PilM